ncbi:MULTISPECIES: DUF1287 domain-containing protein [Providencia]|uniref:DUF1287 domain-containing protein n=1 Tax=Providencia TaxID=586 RepID=UPI0015719F10|nr:MULTISPECIES: DUF1287 domain-containing protein [Providencia]
MEIALLKQLFPVLFLLFTPYSMGVNNLTLAKHAEQLPRLVAYDASYQRIDYPNGDVPSHYGVCSDVVIRSYRKVGIDLQKLLHEDIKQSFSQYPSQKMWGLRKPDTNIDHRRVPNLETFFSRKGIVKPITKNSADYLPGDIVSWRLDNGRPHIGIVTSIKSSDSQSYLVMHNIGYGQVPEDVLFKWKIVGHYSY